MTDNTTFLVASGERLLGTEQGVLTFSEDQVADADVGFPLGSFEEKSYSLAIYAEGHHPASVNAEELAGLRQQLARVETEEQYVLLSMASQIATWHATFKFCPRCAIPMETHKREFAKMCNSCGHHQYPRISPCIIVLVSKGDQCLLAHAAHFQKGRYSTLAGFIEAGESAENAVKREVFEEVGIRIKNVKYAFSQSWPFPHSLMLGYHAEYDSGELTPDGIEIMDAQWFKVDELPVLPPRFTIARRLIDQFLVEQGVPLEEDSGLFFAAE